MPDALRYTYFPIRINWSGISPPSNLAVRKWPNKNGVQQFRLHFGHTSEFQDELCSRNGRLRSLLARSYRFWMSTFAPLLKQERTSRRHRKSDVHYPTAVIVLPGFDRYGIIAGEGQAERTNPTEQTMIVTFHALTAVGIAHIAAIR